MNTKDLGLVAYEATFNAMRAFTDARDASTPDEIWYCQHPAVFTQGLAGKADHVHDAGDIPVVSSNRGGQVTYHGPGQLIAYPLIDLTRAGYFVKEYVYKLEEAVIRTLATVNVVGHRVRSAPGIYVRLDNPFDHAKLGTTEPGEDPFRGLGKISALGIKVSRHCTYHGLALNVQMDLQPFDRINPCGYAGLRTVDLHTIGVSVPVAEIQTTLDRHLRQFLVTP
ncbi:MAG: lipoyl(octanoyl) transferase LipB [Burkholderiaceae bacterium]|nr:lipoyl(octanoyl) transferase LipB [Burkholderiaceae bacterium]